MFHGDKITPKSDFLATCGVVVTLTFDLLTSRLNQFIVVPKCTEVVNLVTFLPAVYENIYITLTIIFWGQTHGGTTPKTCCYMRAPNNGGVIK